MYADTFIRISNNISVLVRSFRHANMYIICMVIVNVDACLQFHQINDNQSEATRDAKHLHILFYFSLLVLRFHLE